MVIQSLNSSQSTVSSLGISIYNEKKIIKAFPTSKDRLYSKRVLSFFEKLFQCILCLRDFFFFYLAHFKTVTHFKTENWTVYNWSPLKVTFQTLLVDLVWPLYKKLIVSVSASSTTSAILNTVILPVINLKSNSSHTKVCFLPPPQNSLSTFISFLLHLPKFHFIFKSSQKASLCNSELYQPIVVAPSHLNIS